MTNVYKKYCSNVWLAQTTGKFERGDIIEVTTRRDKVNEHYVHNLVFHKDGFNYYSITRVDGTNAQTVAERKADKYLGWADSAVRRSEEYYEKSNKYNDFLRLGEPIKVGHHSENGHCKMLEDNWRNLGKSVEMSEKAEKHQRKAAYWKRRTNNINLSMPESIEYFKVMLDDATEEHRQIKTGEKERSHSYSLTYAKKRVNELTDKYEKALKLWSHEGLAKTQAETRQEARALKKKEREAAVGKQFIVHCSPDHNEKTV